MRKRDPVVREKILSYIKAECLREGGIIERSCKEIAEAVGVNPRNGERILNVVQSLQNSGNIIIYPRKRVLQLKKWNRVATSERSYYSVLFNPDNKSRTWFKPCT